MQRRLITAIIVGITSGILCGTWQMYRGTGAGDIGWAIRLLPDLFNGSDPYGYPISLTPMAYPLTAGIIAAPLALVMPALAAGLFFGLASAMLANGLLREQQWWKLLVFLTYPYWIALHTVQWAPLLLAVTLYPALLPLTLVKPHIGLPIALTNLSGRRVVACCVLGLASLALMPDWPIRWLGHQAAPVRYMWPLLTLPFGPVIILATMRWHDTRAKFLLLFATVPQHRWGYDTLLLWFLPTTPRQGLLMFAASWLGAAALVAGTVAGGVALGTALAVASWYLPALICVLQRGGIESGQRTQGAAD